MNNNCSTGRRAAFDYAGNPYATTPKNILKRNTGFTPQAEQTLNGMNLTSQLKENAGAIIKDPKNVPVVESRIDKYPELVNKLYEAKMPDCSRRFTMDDINSLLLNVRAEDLKNPSGIFTAIQKADKYEYEKGAFGVWKCPYY